MMSAFDTRIELSHPDKFRSFYQELKTYLRSKLTLIEVKGACSYYSCGHDHHRYSDPTWKPFKHLEHYCKKKGFDWMEAKDMIEEHLEKRLICECQLVNDENANRRARLQKIFGLDFGEPGRETCGLL